MNYKPLIVDKLREYQKEFPEYSFCQILYSAVNVLRKQDEFKKTDLLNISDQDFYTALSKSFSIESDTPNTEIFK